MKNIKYILYTLVALLFFASCEEENVVMQDDEPCYSLFVSLPNDATRASYQDNGPTIAVKWEKGDIITLTTDGKKYSFLFRSYDENSKVGEFYFYGTIPLKDDKFVGGSKLTFHDIKEGANNAKEQTQVKNNDCREYLLADVGGKSLNYNDTKKTYTTSDVINLAPESEYRLLHIQVVSPGTFIGTSKLKIVGLADEDYIINLGNDVSHVFADEGETMDLYIIVSNNLTIAKNKKIEFYFYAYDEATKSTEKGEEFRYYMVCNQEISTKDIEVLKLPLPDKAKNILHIIGKAPAEIPVGSRLLVEGWKQEANAQFSTAVTAGGDIDMYVTVPDLAKIENATDLKVFIYAYDNVTGKWDTGDEYHYYMSYSGAKNKAVVNVDLPDRPTHTAIQLGLSVKWATMNIGATSDQPGKASYGGYYPWGLVEEDYQLSRSTDGSSNGLSYYIYNKSNNTIADFFPYSSSEGKGIQGLYKQDRGRKYGDAATYKWGEKWIIPTPIQMREFLELMIVSRDKKQFTDWNNWKNWDAAPAGSRPTDNGWWVYGKGAYSEKKIWLPAAGCVVGSGSYNSDNPASNDGYIGVYMTSLPGTDYNSTSFLFFDGHTYQQEGQGEYNINAYPDADIPSTIYENYGGRLQGSMVIYKHNGISVRPIRNPNK